MAQVLTLLHYNNYFDRIYKKAGNYINNYQTEDVNYTNITDINFNPADGVETELVVGKGVTATSAKELDSYDYCILSDGGSTGTVLSRWFIIDRERTRNNQYKLILRRDVLVDKKYYIQGSPIFIEKGIITDANDPLLFNNEGMTYNQIKVEETPLKDDTGCGWVVGYIPQDAFSDAPKTITKDVIVNSSSDITVAGIANWTYYSATQLASDRKIWSTEASAKKVLKLNTIEYWKSTKTISSTTKYGYVEVPQNGTTAAIETSLITTNVTATHAGANYAPRTYNQVRGLASAMPTNTSLWILVNDYLQKARMTGNLEQHTSTEISNLRATDGKIIQDSSTGLYYRIKVKNVYASAETKLNTGIDTTTSLLSTINGLIDRSYYDSTAGIITVTGNYSASDVSVGYNVNGYQILLEQVQTFAAIEIDNQRSHCMDAPYDIFCIPYSDTKKLKLSNSVTVTCSKELAIAMAQEIAKDAGSGSIYDTQLLPYCPSQALVTKNPGKYADTATLDIRNLSFDTITNATNSYTSISIANQAALDAAIASYGTVYDNNKSPIYFYSSGTSYYRRSATGNAIGAVIWCESATRSFDINTSISASSTALGRKIENETEFYRLCSGNYQGMFEFSAAKSFGVPGFRVDCTFKPFNPYIHVVPKLGGLYGDFAGFGDVRGLICGGDFSLAQLSNTWANYELQNKNYQNIFDRQIQNMDVNNNINIKEAGWSALAGTLQGGAVGAGTGFMMGGPIGAAVGGTVGTVSSALGAVGDMMFLKQRQQEARSFATDMYGYNLQNIQAIPTSLSKNSALTANTKIFPFIEKYSCTDVEKQALEDKITYNGMTVMRIGTIDGWSGYFKGQVIRIAYGADALDDDTHMANAIYEEINKGVYL